MEGGPSDGLDSKPAVPQQRMNSNSEGLPGRLDPDVASLSLTVDQHMQALMKEAVDHLLAVKARLHTSLDAAVDQEHEDGNKRLQAKQAELDAAAADLKHTEQLLGSTELVLDRVAGGYAAKQRAVHDKLSLLRSWYAWREWTNKENRLQYVGLRLQQWYVRRWLLGRAWDRWLGQAHLQYRTLVAERAEKQQKADAAALHAIHAQVTGALRSQLEGLQAQLQEEAEARNRMEEEMKRSFMRGVTAINLEALQMMRRGAPPQGANPFPVRVPLTACTAAAGLTASAEEQQQHGSAGVVGDSGAAAEQPVDGLTATLQDWALTQQEQQGAAAAPAAAGYQVSCASPAKTQAPTADAGPAGWSAAGGYGYGVGQPQSSQTVASSLSSQAQSVYGAAAVVQLQPHGQQQHVGAVGGRLGLAASSQQPMSPGAGTGAPFPRVYVARGPARASPIAATQAQKGAASSSSPQTGRSAGLRRSLHFASSGKASQRQGGR